MKYQSLSNWPLNVKQFLKLCKQKVKVVALLSNFFAQQDGLSVPNRSQVLSIFTLCC